MTELALKSALELAAMIRDRHISSLELLEHLLARVEAHNGPINAVVTLDAEGARQRAKQADAELAAGKLRGPLHGVPMTIKDAYEVANLRSTGGAPIWQDHVPEHNASAVQRLVDAGAVVFGKTNVPAFSSDVQTYNPIFGTTSNPHDVARTPGGSSGGAAAALATGLTPLELGSDIGGSIRTPAHWSGVYGHKPSHGLIPLSGHMPGPPGALTESDLNVGGPLARSAADLDTALSILAGPNAERAKAYSLRLPEPRHGALKDYRVAAWLDDPRVPVDSAVRERLEATVEALRAAGVAVDTEARPGIEFRKFFSTYMQLLAPIIAAGMPEEVMAMLEALAAATDEGSDDPTVWFALGATQRHMRWARLNERRLRMRRTLAAFFDDFDVLLMPVNPVAALVHDNERGQAERQITVNGAPRPYVELMAWISLATLTLFPATAAPVGRTAGGLPVGVQIVGPYLEDRTSIDFAGRLADVIGGFEPPAGYA